MFVCGAGAASFTQRMLAFPQGPLFAGIVLVGDGDEAHEAEFGEDGLGARVHANGQQRRA